MPLSTPIAPELWGCGWLGVHMPMCVLRWAWHQGVTWPLLVVENIL